MPDYNRTIYVVEMLPESDYEQNRAEGEVIHDLGSDLGFNCAPVQTVTGENEFNSAIRGLGDYVGDRTTRGPILGPFLHISAHGQRSGVKCVGIALNDPNNRGGFISWGELRRLLIPVYEAVNDWLVLCLSACCGEAFDDFERELLTDAGDSEDMGLPYYAIVCAGEALGHNTFRGVFEAFYAEAASGEQIDEIVARANRRLGGDYFFCYMHPSWSRPPGV